MPDQDPSIGAPYPAGPTYNPMTHFLQPKISGYRQLTDGDVKLINEIKALGGECQKLIERAVNQHGADGRWAAIAATDLQTGIMALVRSIAKPSGF